MHSTIENYVWSRSVEPSPPWPSSRLPSLPHALFSQRGGARASKRWRLNMRLNQYKGIAMMQITWWTVKLTID